MITEHPWAGVGAGTFHTLVRDLRWWRGYTIPLPDNAQSWYRHLLRSSACSAVFRGAWCVVCCDAVVLARPAIAIASRSASCAARSWASASSLFGMPGQSLTSDHDVLDAGVLVRLVEGQHSAPATRRVAWSKGSGRAPLALVAVHAAITLRRCARRSCPRNGRCASAGTIDTAS